MPKLKFFSTIAPTAGYYKVAHYYRRSSRLMSYTTRFFLFAFVIYNCLPLAQLFYEYFSPQRQVSYRFQSNTWYPWQALSIASWWSFTASYLCQVQSSLTGVAFIMAGEFWLCFFITQMQMHYDFLDNALQNLNAAAEDAVAQLKALIDYHNKLLRQVCKIVDCQI